MLMAAEGAKIVVVDPGVNVDGTGSDTSAADKTVEAIRDTGGEAVPCYESVVTMEGGERIVKTAVDSFGRLDIVVTCAGILRDRMVFNMTEQEWDDVIAVHLKGTFAVVKPACVLFRQQRSGRVITFTSTSGLYGNVGQANYGAAKDGIAGFTRVVARDMGRYGVTANSVAPAALTRMTESVPEEVRQLWATQHIPGTGLPLIEGMPDSADQIAPFVVWLASDEAGHVNGHIFYVAGGLVALFNEPEPVKTIHKEGQWSVEELIKVFPDTLGVELFNPAPPPQPPPSSS